MRPGHDILTTPLEVPNRAGQLKVLNRIPQTQAEMGIPNHRRELLEKCIADLEKKSRYRRALEILQRYTGIENFGASSKAWRKWFLAKTGSLGSSKRTVLAQGLTLAVGWITSFTAYPEGSSPLAEAFASLVGAVGKEGGVAALLGDESAVTRILAACYLVCKTRGLPHDFVFDALEGDPTVRERARAALERAREKKK